MTPSRDRVMDILLSLAMIFVVAGHMHQPYWAYFKVYAFHVPLLFFISGYFFRPRDGWEQKIAFIKGKVWRLLVPYFIYNIIFAVITYVIYLALHQKLGELPTLTNFFITPFVDGQQYDLFAPGWFLIYLFYIHLIFVFLVRKATSLIYHLRLLGGLFLIALFWVVVASFVDLSTHEVISIFARIGFASFFYGLGYVIKTYIHKLQPYLVNIPTFILCLGVSLWFMHFQPEYRFTLFPVYFNSDYALAPFVSSIIGIWTWYQVSVFISRFISERSFLLLIGKHSIHVMATHLFVFLSMHILYVWAAGGSLTEPYSAGNAFLRPYIWWLYIAAGLMIPAYLAALFANTHKKPLTNAIS